jgi:hypothetical protein
MLLDRGDVALGHVHRDDLEAHRSTSPELGEELAEGLFLPSLAHPHDVALVVVPDDGQVLLLPFAIADLVDADASERAAEPPFCRLLDMLLDQPHDRRPMDAVLTTDRLDGGSPDPAEQPGFEGQGHPRTGASPGHPLDPDAAPPAPDPTQWGDDQGTDAPPIEVTPATGRRLGVEVIALGLSAARADSRFPCRREPDHPLPGRVVERHLLDTPPVCRTQLLCQYCLEHLVGTLRSWSTRGYRWDARSVCLPWPALRAGHLPASPAGARPLSGPRRAARSAGSLDSTRPSGGYEATTSCSYATTDPFTRKRDEPLMGVIPTNFK